MPAAHKDGKNADAAFVLLFALFVAGIGADMAAGPARQGGTVAMDLIMDKPRR